MRRVVFLCIGNACRSQMAEGFARTYGRDVMDAWSAGLYPATAIPEQTMRIMAEKNIVLQHAFPKRLDEVPPPVPDLYVNMSGLPVPGGQFVETRVWDVKDPYQLSDDMFRKCRDEIERLVMALIMELRTKGRATSAAPQSSDPRGGDPRGGAPGRRGWRRGL
jgi:arsenate reductase